MDAIVITKKGGPEVLKLEQVAKPVPQGNEILIKVHAAGINRSDVMSRQSNVYGAGTKTEIPGLEISGIVEAAGPDAKRWKAGDRVCALIAGGGYAEYRAVDERLCLPIPEGLSFEEAASLPETIFTIWSNVFKDADFKAGENFLIHGGTSGIGVTAIQMVVAMGGIAYATAGTQEKCRFCEELGAVKAVNYKTEDFVAILKPIGIDVILDMTGGENTLKNMDILNPDGRITFINAMNGSKSEIDILQMMNKRLVITGSMLKPRTDDFKAILSKEIEQAIWPLITAGKIKPVIYKVFPLVQAADAQRLMESSTHIGKIILKVGSY
ncbi:putative PIG3 family NAD(P)H quinone oxidoreductase [Pedobacter cryoconitis]|uniref:Putative PIG3 family NAD(P)H quinone oxidoreductase n=1 Tax=Pedobacter cryoconitis TaxID=188932 RepID=A0A7W8ZHW2_9SPHI|nr:NAD(P)H-quinone oxidoreductase [Pedobacter cryoconitis]MBB5634155.1 putative PIG3 family NAD(P)H quinone oxidoreductase [Pedobacter cryoconitis]